MRELGTFLRQVMGLKYAFHINLIRVSDRIELKKL